MMPGRLWLIVRSVLTGWAALIPMAYLVERLLVRWAARLLGATWLSTVTLALDCLVLSGAGWIVGRLHRSAAIPGVLAFAATLAVVDLHPWLALNVPWLLRLAVNAFGNTLFLDSLAATAAEHVFLFGSLFAGALLSRPRVAPASIFGLSC